MSTLRVRTMEVCVLYSASVLLAVVY